jgi:hypothetical protein
MTQTTEGRNTNGNPNTHMIQLLSNIDVNNLETPEYVDEPLLFKRSSVLLDSRSCTGRGDGGARRMTKLTPDFTPGSFDVVCARGGDAKNHEGNRNFRRKIKESADAYAKAEGKLFKSLVVSKVVNWIRKASLEGGFVKPINGVWYEVGDYTAREKVGQALRDQNHSQYKSSTKAKRRRWKHEKQVQTNTDGYLEAMVKESKFITEEMLSVETQLERLGGNQASDESLLELFTSANANILKAMCADSHLQASLGHLPR